MRLAPRQEVQMVLALIVLLPRRRAILHYSHVSHTFQNAERRRQMRLNPWPSHKPAHPTSFLRHPLALGEDGHLWRRQKKRTKVSHHQRQRALASMGSRVYPLAFREKRNSATTSKASW